MNKAIWDVENEYYKLAPLTEQMIIKAEAKLKVKLPESYINLLKEQNGGSIQYNAFPMSVPTSWADDHINVDHILGIGEQQGIVESDYFINEWGLPENIVLFSGDGHSWVAFDYRNKTEEPPILYIDIDAEQIIEIASNFDQFLEGLYVAQIELDNTYFEEEIEQLSREQLNAALSSTNEEEIIPSLNYLYENTKGNEAFIEEKLILLLQNPVLNIKEIGVIYANHMYDMGVLSSDGIKQIVSIIQKDKDLESYAERFR